jgi:very-short-patch-repair endonuclease
MAHLKGKQFYGYDFHRQKPLLNYIADFYCYELNLVIELDGYSHHFEEIIDKDESKQLELEKVGLIVLRFNDDEVLKDINNVLRVLEAFVESFKRHTPTPYPLKRGNHSTKQTLNN